MKKVKNLAIWLIVALLLVVFATAGIKEIIATNTSNYVMYTCEEGHRSVGPRTARTCQDPRCEAKLKMTGEGYSATPAILAEAEDIIKATGDYSLGQKLATDKNLVKTQQDFYTVYKCSKDHLSTATGCSYDVYGNTTTDVTKITKCPYPGCNLTVKEISRNDLVRIREQYMTYAFNNVYCVSHSQKLDFGTGRSGMYKATVKVEIEGETATFYTYNNNSWKKIGTIIDASNNIIATILSDGSLEKGYGGYLTYATSQKLVYANWNNWVKMINSKGTIFQNLGFVEDKQNETGKKDSNGNIKEEDFNAIQLSEAEETTFSKVSNKSHNVTFYLLQGSSKDDILMEYSAYDESGNVYYTIRDDADYSRPYTNTQTLILVHIPIEVTKVWDDNDNAGGTRPASITVELYANGSATGKKLTLSEANNWTAKFEKISPVDENGKEITYTVKEISVLSADYRTQITGDQYSGFIITNSLNTIDIPVTKVWNDNNNAGGKRPTSITVELYKNDSATGKKVTLNESNNWTATFTGLQAIDSNGKEIKYTVKEITVPTNYTTPIYTGSATQGFTITNTIETTEITVTKSWNDSDNKDGIRPTAVTVILYANGTATSNTAVLSASNNWKHTFTGLQKYSSGKEIKYTVKDAVTGYTVTEGNSSNNYTVTNTHEPEKINIKILKVWDDKNNQDGIRTESITVKLLKNGTAIETITLNASNNWTQTIKDLYRYENGKEITYTVQEVSVPTGYTAKVTKSDIADSTITYTVTNLHTPEQIAIPVEKVWNDNNNAGGKRPKSVTVKLLADGSDTGKTLTLSQTNNWKGSFSGLNKYKAVGQEIKYTVEEVAVDKYVSVVTGNSTKGYTITNTSYDGYIEISGKVWLDKKSGKANQINGTFGDEDKVLSGIKVTLKDKAGNQFDATSTAITDADGTYRILVNYDNSKNVYKLYENSATVEEKLKTAYVEFEYDGLKYTTVANAETGENTSKAKENETTRNTLDGTYSTITSSTKYPETSTMTASTNGVISFETYADKKETTSKEVIKYCNGNSSFTRTNSTDASGKVETVTGYNCTNSNHSTSGHVLEEYEVELTKILNVNLGLFEREQPDMAIFSDLTKVEVTLEDEQYTYLYGIRGGELEAKGGLQVKFQNKDTYTYKRPVNPADIAYINSTDKDMQVSVTYEVKVYNSSSTLPMTVHKIKNYFDKEYTMTSSGWTTTENADYKTAINDKDLNITVQPLDESDAIVLTYQVSLEAIKNLLNENATLNNAVEIESYSTTYGETTLYAEQRTGERTGNPYCGKDKDSTPGNAEIYLSSETERLEAKVMEDDTDFAPSFVLCKDETAEAYRTLSGTIWEDAQTSVSAETNERLGDGLKTDGENNVEGVKVELYEVETNNLAILYGINENNEPISSNATTYSDENGKYSFTKIIHNGKEYEGGVVPGDYYIKYTYGNGDTSYTTAINDVQINGIDYKSTILTGKIAEIFKGSELSENDVNIETTEINWPLEIPKNISIAIDNMYDRMLIQDLQASTLEAGYSITASSKQFRIGLEHTTKESGTVNKDGEDNISNVLDVFNFGIIERPRQNVVISKVVSNITVTLANGQNLINGNPNDNIPYVKAINNKPSISGTRRIIAEIDSELMQGATLGVTYQITVTNNSEIDYDYYNGDVTDTNPYSISNVNTGYYYYGNKAGLSLIKPTVKCVVDYMDKDLVLSNYDATNWTATTATTLQGEGLISETVNASDIDKGYQVFATEMFKDLEPGESADTSMNVSKLLANETSDTVYDNHVEILTLGAKIARTRNGNKQSTPGNYNPATSEINETDDDKIDVIITPPTGAMTYIIYAATVLVGLSAISIAIIFIKKKILTK